MTDSKKNKPKKDQRTGRKDEDRIVLPLDPEEALRAMLAVKPGDECGDDHE